MTVSTLEDRWDQQQLLHVLCCGLWWTCANASETDLPLPSFMYGINAIHSLAAQLTMTAEKGILLEMQNCSSNTFVKFSEVQFKSPVVAGLLAKQKHTINNGHFPLRMLVQKATPSRTMQLPTNLTNWLDRNVRKEALISRAVAWA